MTEIEKGIIKYDKNISYSSLMWFMEHPMLYKKMSNKEIKEDRKEYFDMGRLIHMKLLRPDMFNKKIVEIDDKPMLQNHVKFVESYKNLNSLPKNERIIKAYESSYSTNAKSKNKIEQEANSIYDKFKRYIDLTYMSDDDTMFSKKSDIYTASIVAESVIKNDFAKKLILFDECENEDFISKNEFLIEWMFPIMYHNVELKCKSIIDKFTIDRKNKVIKLIELKTSSDTSAIKDSIEKYNYLLQLCFYWMAITYYIKNILKDDSVYKTESYIIAAQTNIEKYTDSRVILVYENTLSDNIQTILNLIETISFHISIDKWDFKRCYYENMCERL